MGTKLTWFKKNKAVNQSFKLKSKAINVFKMKNNQIQIKIFKLNKIIQKIKNN